MIKFVITLFVLYRIYRWLKPKYPPTVLNIYFGVPGSGKTTYAAYLAKICMDQSRLITWCVSHPSRFSSWLLNSGLLKRRMPVFSNVPITGTYELDAKGDIGRYMIEKGKVLIDEAGIEYNNRKFKSFSEEAIYWYKYHRHYECSVDVFSQSFDDMDITLRRLAQNLFFVKKSIIPYFIVCRRIKRRAGIDKITHQPIDEYYWGLPIISSKWVFAPPLWKLFNSFSRKELPDKEWSVW